MNKPDISELLEQARKLSLHTAKWGHDDLYFQSFSDYENALSPDKMIALLEYVGGLEEKISAVARYIEKKEYTALEAILVEITLMGEAND